LYGRFCRLHRAGPPGASSSFGSWKKRLQLPVSDPAVEEYLAVFAEALQMSRARVAAWRDRFLRDRRCTRIGLGRRLLLSRDPDDNVFLSTAAAGGADYLITNDRDRLEIEGAGLGFRVLTPHSFLGLLE
jgi:predicted nucleic acid-binding protein